MDISAVRAAVAAQITAVIPGPLTSYAYQPAMPTVPAVWIKPSKIEYDRSFGPHGTEIANFELIVVVALSDDLSGQALLDQYVHGTGSLSIKAAVEAGRAQYGGSAYTGVFDDCWISSMDGYQQYTAGTDTWFGATLHMIVVGKGSI